MLQTSHHATDLGVVGGMQMGKRETVAMVEEGMCVTFGSW